MIESNTPYLYGYAGWFEPVNDVIEIGDELDQIVILHELTHRWFNDQMFSTRWINEGLAEELAAQAMAELDGDPEASKLPPASDPGSPAAQHVVGPAAPVGRHRGSRRPTATPRRTRSCTRSSTRSGRTATRRVLRAADADRIAVRG